MIINGETIDLSESCNDEHKYSPDEFYGEEFRQVLSESFKYQIDQHFDDLRAESKNPESSLTWTNILVESNYSVFGNIFYG